MLILPARGVVWKEPIVFPPPRQATSACLALATSRPKDQRICMGESKSDSE